MVKKKSVKKVKKIKSAKKKAVKKPLKKKVKKDEKDKKEVKRNLEKKYNPWQKRPEKRHRRKKGTTLIGYCKCGCMIMENDGLKRLYMYALVVEKQSRRRI